MKLVIENINAIIDNGANVSIELITGSVVVLPPGDHSIELLTSDKSGSWELDGITVELHSR